MIRHNDLKYNFEEMECIKEEKSTYHRTPNPETLIWDVWSTYEKTEERSTFFETFMMNYKTWWFRIEVRRNGVYKIVKECLKLKP